MSQLKLLLEFELQQKEALSSLTQKLEPQEEENHPQSEKNRKTLQGTKKFKTRDFKKKIRTDFDRDRSLTR